MGAVHLLHDSWQLVPIHEGLLAHSPLAAQARHWSALLCVLEHDSETQALTYFTADVRVWMNITRETYSS
jgi:hypothetical protein